MFDIGWSEMAVIALVALVVLGPKELPQAMKTFASFTRKMQRYAREFRSGVDNIIREAELEDAKKALDAVRANPKNLIKKVVDPTGEALDAVADVEKAARDKGDGPAAALPGPTAAGSTVGAAAPAEKTSNLVVQPTSIAPPHSIRPPAPKEPVPVPVAKAAGEPPAGSGA